MPLVSSDIFKRGNCSLLGAEVDFELLENLNIMSSKMHTVTFY